MRADHSLSIPPYFRSAISSFCIATWTLVFIACLAQAGNTQSIRLQVTENQRYLETSEGEPFFYLGDTAWELFHRLTREEAMRYLDHRAQHGYTVIQAVAAAQLGGVEAPNAYGETVFIDEDPSRPNEAYFEHVDFIVNEANERGLVVGFLPTWGSHWKQGGGQVFTPESAEAYGRFLGERYQDASLIWILGGDQNITHPNERAIIHAMAAGLRAGDGGAHLITFHPRGPGLSSQSIHEAEWLDFHMAQTSHAARDHDTGIFIEHDLGLTPLRPTLDGEPRYETIQVGFYLDGYSELDRFDAFDVRQAAYWAVMAGACGHTYGHNSIWQMHKDGGGGVLSPVATWEEALDHAGGLQMKYLRRLFESRPFTRLTPGQDFIVDAPQTGGAKVRGIAAEDRSFLLVYSPYGESFTVDKNFFETRQVKEIWYNPRYGNAYAVHVTDNFGYQTYTPPTQGRGRDWVLILEDAGQNFPLPGE